MLRHAVVLLAPLLAPFLAACGTTGGGVGSPASCVLDDVLDSELAGQSTHDCGHLDADASTPAYTSAKNCVLAAIESNEPFVVVWDIQGIDSKVARAYYGVIAEAGLAISSVAYDGDPRGGGGEGHPRTTTSSCSALQSSATCAETQLPVALCLQCASQTVTDTCSTP